MKKDLTIILILVVALSGTICSDGIDYGRTIYDGELSNSGHSWTGYAKHCSGDHFALKFNIKNLTGGMQVNLNLNGSNRYAIGFVDLENGSIATNLFRQEKGNVEDFPGKVLDYNPSATYQGEIVSGNARVQVFLGRLLDGDMIKVIDYFDTAPLPSGVIDFETLENSSVQLRNVTVNCEAPMEEKPPSMGVAHFKPPNDS
jgi:hypothetical protein